MIEHRLPRWDLPREAVRLDRAHPFAGRFTSVYLPGISSENLGSGGAGSIVANTHPKTIIPSGPALRLSGTAANVTFGRSFGPTPSYPLTMVIVCRQGASTNGAIAAIAASSAIGSSYWYVGGGSSSQISLGARNNFGSTLSMLATVPADANGNQAIGQDLVIVAQSLSASDHRLCVNGSAIVTATTNIGSMVAWDRLYLGQSSGTSNLDVAAALFAHGGAGLSDAQMRQLSSTPRRVWGLFDPIRLEMPDSYGGGSGWSVAAVETAAAADTCSATFSPSAAIDETATPSDISTAAIDAVAALVETTSPTDLATAAATLLRAIAEQATPADAATASFSGAGSAAIVETAAPSDAITAAATLLRQVAESTTPNDQATAAATLVRLITEQAVPVDQATVQGGDAWTVSIEELATAIDVITATFTGGAAALLSAPPIGHGPDLARRVVAALASRRPNLRSRTR